MLAKLAGNYEVTIDGVDYLLILSPAGLNYGKKNIMELTLHGGVDPFGVAAQSYYEVPGNVSDLRRGVNRLQKNYYVGGEVGRFFGKQYFVDKLAIRRGSDDELTISSFSLHRTGYTSFAYPTRTIRGIERVK